MDLAIVLAVSEYQGKLAPLPGCVQDSEIIETILRKETRFVDPLVIKTETNSATAKGRIVDFITQHKGKEINEILFYFSGHGLFKDSEFFYLLSDFDPTRTKQTSLENAELDNYIKALAPKVAVKIVDACQSGISYVKDDDSMSRYLKGSQGDFKTCYFLFSSQSDQSSYQDHNISEFTKNIAHCIHDHAGSAVRYKDIIDYVSDRFAGNPSQTPFFVTQADFTERFCGVDDSLRKALQTILSYNLIPRTSMVGSLAVGTKVELRDIVAREAQEYCNAEEVDLILNGLQTKIRTAQAPAYLLDLYDLEFEIGTDYSGMPSLAAIGKWIEKNEHNYFAEPQIETQKLPLEGVELILSTYRLATFPWGAAPKEKIVQRTVGVKSTTDMAFRYIKVIATPKYPNVHKTSCIVVPLVSKTRLAVFSAMLNYKEAGWNEVVLDGNPDWHPSEIKLKDSTAMDNCISTIMSKYWSFTLDPILERFGMLEKQKQGCDQVSNTSSNAETAPKANE